MTARPPDVDDGEVDAGSRVKTLPGVFNLSDLGNAERLVAQYRDRIRYCKQRNKWLLWDRSRWRWDETDAIIRMAKRTVKNILHEAAEAPDALSKDVAQWAIRSEEARRIKSMIELAQSETGVPVQLADLDADPWLLNVSNGTVELKTGTLRDARQSDLITRSTNVAFKASAKSALWDKVLSEACGNDAELSEYLQRVVGYSLLGDPVERACFFLYGPPGTAKSTFVEACHVALGEYSMTASFDTWLVQTNTGGNRDDLVRLAGARLVTSVEVSASAKWDDSLLNTITGGEDLTAAAKYERHVTFKPSFSLLFAANNAPTVSDSAEGFWKRMRRIPLTAQIPPEKQDRGLKARLHEPKHAEAILAWAIAGCVKYQQGGFSESVAVSKSTAEYKAELDHFAEFLSDCYVFDKNGWVMRKALRLKYEEWSKEVGRKSLLTAQQIAKRLETKSCTQGAVRGERLWRGIRERIPADEVRE